MYKSRSNSRQASLFWDLETMLDPKHPLFKLANMINWSCFEEAFAPLFCADNGRPPKPIRLMVGLLMLKHLRNVSDEQVVVQFTENAYYQYFCGMEAFGIAAPCLHISVEARIHAFGYIFYHRNSVLVRNYHNLVNLIRHTVERHCQYSPCGR